MRVVRADVAADPRFRERFLERAAAAAALRHPSIVALSDCGLDDGILYSVSDYVDSLTLSEHLSRLPAQRRMTSPTVGRCVGDIAAAIDYAHGLGIAHGALRPGNVLVGTRDGRAMVTDLGLARPDAPLTMARTSIAAHAHLAPELAEGATDATPAGDLYAFAAMLHEIAAGQPPLGRVLAAIAGHPGRPTPPLRLTAPDLPDDLAAVLARGLAASPGDRYGSAGELAAAWLAAVAGRSPDAAPPDASSEATAVGPRWTPPPPDPPAPPPAPRRPVPVPGGRALATAAVLALGAGAFLGVSWAVERAPAPTPPRAAPGLPTPVQGVVGAPMRVGSLRLTLLGVDPGGQPPLALSLGPGERFLVIGVQYENQGRGPAIVSPYDWTLVDASGAIYGPVETDAAGALAQRELPPGQTARGMVGFIVPEGAQGLVATFSAEPSNESAQVALS